MKGSDFFNNVDLEGLGKNFSQAIDIVNKSIAVVPEKERSKYSNLISKVNQVNRSLKDKGFSPENLEELEKLNDSLTKECKDMGAQ